MTSLVHPAPPWGPSGSFQPLGIEKPLAPAQNQACPTQNGHRLARKSLEEIVSVTKQIFDYEPRPWQLKLFTKCAEGYDTFAIAGTGYGKSLVFTLLAIAVELAGCKGTVMIVCPLKSLELDQVCGYTDRHIKDSDHCALTCNLGCPIQYGWGNYNELWKRCTHISSGYQWR